MRDLALELAGERESRWRTGSRHAARRSGGRLASGLCCGRDAAQIRHVLDLRGAEPRGALERLQLPMRLIARCLVHETPQLELTPRCELLR